MNTMNGLTPMLDGCDVLPPMETSEPPSDQSKRNQKTGLRKTGNRFAMLNAFVDSKACELSRSEMLVWMVLFRDTRHGIAATSQSDIARRTKLSSRTVRNAITGLRNRRLLKVVYRGGLNRGISRYQVSLDS